MSFDFKVFYSDYVNRECIGITSDKTDKLEKLDINLRNIFWN